MHGHLNVKFNFSIAKQLTAPLFSGVSDQL